MRNLQLKRQLAAFSRSYRVRVTNGTSEYPDLGRTCHTHREARRIAGKRVREGYTAHIVAVLSK